MALFNYATKEITIKIVYYGPGLSGKTTNLQYLHSVFEPSKRGKLLSLATEADRTLFFDFLPVQLGKISDFAIRFQLYTVPGQVRYNATRKLVLKGADAVVFVADSQREMREQNIESLVNMRDNLIANNINPDDIPVMLQYNKRDLANILSIDQLNKDMNENGKYEYKEAIAVDGNGVEETFQHITKLVIRGISEKHKIKVQPAVKVPDAFVEEKPKKETIVESVTLPDMEVEQTRYAGMPVMKKEIQTTIPEESYQPEETVAREVREIWEEPVVSKEKEIQEIEEATVILREKEIEEIKEALAGFTKKMDLIVNNMTEISLTLKELKDAISIIQSEVKDAKKEQKGVETHLREITDTLDNIKAKKRWFSFS